MLYFIFFVVVCFCVLLGKKKTDLSSCRMYTLNFQTVNNTFLEKTKTDVCEKVEQQASY
jgi:hypothetical protein